MSSPADPNPIPLLRDRSLEGVLTWIDEFMQQEVLRGPRDEYIEGDLFVSSDATIRGDLSVAGAASVTGAFSAASGTFGGQALGTAAFRNVGVVANTVPFFDASGNIGIGGSPGAYRLDILSAADDIIRVSSPNAQKWAFGVGHALEAGSFFIARDGVSRDFRIGADGIVRTARVNLGDDNFSLGISGSPEIVFDPTDRIYFDRGANAFGHTIAGVNRLVVNASGISVDGTLDAQGEIRVGGLISKRTAGGVLAIAADPGSGAGAYQEFYSVSHGTPKLIILGIANGARVAIRESYTEFFTPVGLPSYSVFTVPAASAHGGRLAMIGKLVYSDGINWRNVEDDLVVA